MVSRIIQTSKDPTDQKEDLEKLKQILRKSHYPAAMIEGTMQDM